MNQKFLGLKSRDQIMEIGKNVIRTEAAALHALASEIDSNFYMAVNVLLNCEGKVMVTGLGKSGLVGRKIAATLSSTGTPAVFLHSTEANHGDLGSIQDKDILLAVSNSGEGEDIMLLASSAKRRNNALISISGNRQSSLSTIADINLDASCEKEACPLGLAPTTSSTLALSLGDALAIATLEARGFKSDDFAKSHPSGTLGRKLLTLVQDIMRTGKNIPCVKQNDTVESTIIEMTKKGMGMTLVMEEGAMVGIFTDGDLRRFFQDTSNNLSRKIGEVMTKEPETINHDALAIKAAELMQRKTITHLVATEKNKKKVRGVIDMHDLLRAKVI